MSGDWRQTLGERFRAAELSNGARLVALAIATYADHATGAGAWPSQVTLAKVTGLNRRSVQRALQRLETAGIIQVQRTGRVSRYAFTGVAQGPQQRRRTGTPKGRLLAPQQKRRAETAPGRSSGAARPHDPQVPQVPQGHGGPARPAVGSARAPLASGAAGPDTTASRRTAPRLIVPDRREAA